MEIQSLPYRFPSLAVRFGQLPPDRSPAWQAIRDRFDRVSTEAEGRLRRLSANEQPNTAVSRGKKRVRNGLLPLLAAMAGLGSLLLPGQAIPRWQAGQPSRTVMARNAELQPAFQNMATQLRLLQGTGMNSQNQADFETAFRNLVSKIVDVMERHPDGSVDQALNAKVRALTEADSQTAPETAASALAMDIQQYLLQAGLPASPNDTQINQAMRNFQQDFVEVNETLQKLSPEQQQAFIRDLIQTLKDHRYDIEANSNFTHLLKAIARQAIMDSFGQNPLDLTDLPTLPENSKETAKVVFEQLVNNGYQSLTLQERAALIALGNTALDSINPQTPDFPWAETAIALFMLAGAAALVVTKRQDFFGLPAGFRELAQGLANPVLLITNRGEARQPGGRASTAALNQKIEATASRLATAIQRVSKEAPDPELRQFLQQAFQTAPTADTMVALYTYPVVMDLLQRQGVLATLMEQQIPERAFLEEVWSELETGALTGNVFSVDGPRESALPNLDTDKTLTIAELEQVRRHIDEILSIAMQAYANILIAQESAQLRLEELETKTDRGPEETAELETLDQEILPQLQEDLTETKRTYTSFAEPLRAYRGRVNRAIQEQAQNATLAQLQVAEDSAGEVDPALQEEMIQRQVDAFLAQAQARTERLQHVLAGTAAAG